MPFTLIELFLPIWALIALGYILRRWALRSESFWQRLNKLTYFALIPAMIVSALGSIQLGALPAGGIAITSLMANLAIFALLTGAYLLSPALRASRSEYTSVYQTSTRWNVPLGLVVTLSVFGEQTTPVTAIIMIASIPVINVVNVVFMVLVFRPATAPGRRVVLALLCNPLLLACIAGLIVTGFDLQIWPPADSALLTVGSIAPAAMLLGVGSGIYGAKLFDRVGPVFTASMIKLVAMPLVYLAFAILLGLPPLIASICMVFSAMPTAPNGYVLARQLGGDSRLYTSVLTIQTMVSLVTIPLWIWLAGQVSG